MVGRLSWSRVVFVLGCLVAPACASAADADDASLAPVVEAAEAAADVEATGEASLDAALEQAAEVGGSALAKDLPADERRCIEEHDDLVGFDYEAVLTDVDALDERIVLFDVFIECLGDPSDSEPLVELLNRSMEATLPTIDLSLEEGSCLLQHVLDESDDPARSIIAGDQPGDETIFTSGVDRCFTSENLDILMQAEGTGPQTYGDDPRFDAMQDDCLGGELRACDLLFLVSSTNSDYEAVGMTCGDTAAISRELCGVAVVLDRSGYAPDDSPELQVLADDCGGGDLTSCDLLYRIAPIGHELENLGFTCGGRVAVGAVPDCRTRLG
jgi:hypothetical protein